MEALAENTPEKLLDFIDGQFSAARRGLVSPRLLKNFALDVLVKMKFCLKKFAPEESFGLMRNLRMEKIYDTVSCDALKRFVCQRVEDGFKELDRTILQAGKGEQIVFKANSFAELKFSDLGFRSSWRQTLSESAKLFYQPVQGKKAGIGYWDYVKLRMQKAKGAFNDHGGYHRSCCQGDWI